MAAADIYKIRDEVLALDGDARANLLALIERETARAPYNPSRQETDTWEAVRKVCPPHSIPVRSLEALVGDKRSGVTRTAWREGVAVLYGFAQEAQPVRHSQQDHAALVELLLDCLAHDLRQRRSEVTPRTLIAALPRLRVAVDNCYPGYLEGGMLHKLIRVSAA